MDIAKQLNADGEPAPHAHARGRLLTNAFANRTAISMESADPAVLNAIRAAVLSDEVQRATVAEVTRGLSARASPAANHDREIRKLRQELERLVLALASGDSPTIASEIRGREQRIAMLESERRMPPQKGAAMDPARLRRAIAAKMAEWRKALQADLRRPVEC